VPGSGRHGADRASPGFSEVSTNKPAIVTIAIHVDRADSNDAYTGRAAGDHHSDRADTERHAMDSMHPIRNRHSATRVVANEPVSLIQPSYVKRRREVDNGEQECIKRLCSLVSGARDTRPGVDVYSGASPEFNVIVNTDTGPKGDPNNGGGGYTSQQPGDLDGSADDRATDDGALAAHASASDAAPDLAHATLGGFSANDLAAPALMTPGGLSAPGSCTDAPDDAPVVVVATADAHATAPAAIATAMSNPSARVTKRKANDEMSNTLLELRGKQPKRVRLLTKQQSHLYHAPCEHRQS
jgi:hypothetical protein